MDFVYFLRFEWDSSFRRPYHIELSKYGRFLGVESPVALDLPLRDWSTFCKWLLQKPKLRQVSENLYLYRPYALSCYYLAFKFAPLMLFNRWLLQRSLKPVLRLLNMDQVIVMINHPMMEYVIGTLNERLLCYEVFDEYDEEYGLSAGQRQRLRRAEDRVVRVADVVFTSSRLQIRRRQDCSENVYFVPNAVEFDFFNTVLREETRVPEEVLAIPTPRIGFVGNLTGSADIHLLHYLANAHPEWSLLIIGKRDAEPSGTRELLARPNVYYLGFKDYSLLPSYIKGLDVGLLPYVLDVRTRAVYPNKLHQYLAAGKPVVSTAMPELTDLRDIIGWARDYKEFESEVSRALENQPDEIERRIKVAQENSIPHRTLEKVQILRRLLTARVQRQS